MFPSSYLIFKKCKPLTHASIDISHSYKNSSIDLWLSFWFVCTGALTCVQQPPLSVHSVSFVLKIQLASGLAGQTLFPFIYFGHTAMYIFIPAKGTSRFYPHA